jgi:hypothetical protein
MEKIINSDHKVRAYLDSLSDGHLIRGSGSLHQKDISREAPTPGINTPGERPEAVRPVNQTIGRISYPGTERRGGTDIRSGRDQRLGSRDRRTWQDPHWIGAPDCRVGKSDRRSGRDRRKGTDRRRP